MVDSPAQASSAGQGVHLVLYDGVCALCNRLLQFLLAVDHRAVFDFASLQSATGRAIVARAGDNPDELNAFYVVENYRIPKARVIARSAAAFFVARCSRMALEEPQGVFGVLPAAWLNRACDACRA